jgi:hypothetical protein
VKIAIKGYAPDADPDLEGILTNCNQVVPTVRGFKSAPSAASSGQSVLAGTCQGAAVLEKLDKTTRFFAATGTKVYEASGTDWTDVSGTAYSPASDVRYRFAQFGNVSLVATKSNRIHASSASGTFTGLAAPSAAIVETVNNFVFAFDTNEALFGDCTNRWFCCALGDYTNWTPSIVTQCASGILTGSPGKILAGKRFGDSIIAYKENSMYLGVYVGAPIIWSFTQIPGEVGALSHEAVVSVGTPEQPKHIFMGSDNFYSYDGSRPVPIGNQLREKVFNNELNRAYSYLSLGLQDKQKGNIYFFYCSSNSVFPDKCVVYNYHTGTWGRDDRTVEMVVNYLASGITYDALGSSFSAYDTLSSLSYDAAFASAGTPFPSIFDTTHTLKTLNGVSTTSSLTTGDYGDTQSFSCLSRVIPRFITEPSSGTMTNYYKNNAGDDLTTDAVTSMDSNYRFDILREARWHRSRFDFVGNWELNTLDAQFIGGGNE